MNIYTLEKAIEEWNKNAVNFKKVSLDDYNNDSAAIVFIFDEDANLKKLSWEIRKLFKKYFKSTVTTSAPLKEMKPWGEKERDVSYYMIDFYYTYYELHVEID